jgi:hypothetical protein
MDKVYLVNTSSSLYWKSSYDNINLIDEPEWWDDSKKSVFHPGSGCSYYYTKDKQDAMNWVDTFNNMCDSYRKSFGIYYD